jgi:pimeloyl-ACP methyl ester carboxylesterase
MQCRTALIYGEKSALVSRDTAAYMSEIMGPHAPIIEIANAQHHIMLDEPLAFVENLHGVLNAWRKDDPRAATF